MLKDRENQVSAPIPTEEFGEKYQSLTPFAQATLLYLTTTEWRETSFAEITALWGSHDQRYTGNLSYAEGHINQLESLGFVYTQKGSRGTIDKLYIEPKTLDTMLDYPTQDLFELPQLPPEELLAHKLWSHLRGGQNSTTRGFVKRLASSLRVSRIHTMERSSNDPRLMEIMVSRRLRNLSNLLELARAFGLDKRNGQLNPEYESLSAEIIRLKPEEQEQQLS